MTTKKQNALETFDYICALPQNIIESEDFTNKQKNVLGYLLSLTNTDFEKEHGYIFKTNQEIAKNAGVSEQKLIPMLNKFINLGLLERKAGKRGQASEYIISYTNLEKYTNPAKVSNKVSESFTNPDKVSEKVSKTQKVSNKVSETEDILTLIDKKVSEKVSVFIAEYERVIRDLQNRLTLLEAQKVSESYTNPNAKVSETKVSTDTESDIDIESEIETGNMISEYIEKETANENATDIVETRSGEDATDKEIAEFFAEWGEVEATANSAYDFFDDYSAVTRAEAGEQTEIADTIAKVEYTTDIAEDIATGNSAECIEATETATANDYSGQAYSIAKEIAKDAAIESEITNNNSNIAEEMKDTTQQMRETATLTLEQVLEQQALEYAAIVRQPQQQFNSAGTGEKYDLKADTDKVFKAAKALTIENKAAAFAEVERLDAAYKQRPLTPKQRQWWDKTVAAFHAAVAKIDGVPLQNNVWFVEGTPNVSPNDVNDWLGLVAFYPDSETRRRVFISLLKAQSFTAKVLEYANEKSGFDPITVEDVAAAKRG